MYYRVTLSVDVVFQQRLVGLHRCDLYPRLCRIKFDAMKGSASVLVFSIVMSMLLVCVNCDLATLITVVHHGFTGRHLQTVDKLDLAAKIGQIRQLYPNVLFVEPLGLETAALAVRADVVAARDQEDLQRPWTLRSALVTANLNNSGQVNVAPSSVLTLVSGFRVGVVGYSRGGQQDLQATVAQEAQRLRQSSGVNIVIALGDAGYPHDQMIATRVEDVDVVVTGPERSASADGYPLALTSPTSGRSVPFLKAPLGRLCLTQLAFSSEGQLLAWNGVAIRVRQS